MLVQVLVLTLRISKAVVESRNFASEGLDLQSKLSPLTCGQTTHAFGFSFLTYGLEIIRPISLWF